MSERGKLGKALSLALVHSAFRPHLLRSRPYWGIQAFRDERNGFPAPMHDLAAGPDLNFVPPVSAPLLTADIPICSQVPLGQSDWDSPGPAGGVMETR